MAGHDRLKVELDRLLDEARHSRAAKDALVLLFPKLGDVLGVPATRYGDVPGRAPRPRISKSEYAKSYFRLTPEQAAWSKSQTEDLLSAEPTAVFNSFERKLELTADSNKSKVRNIFLDLIGVAIGNSPDPRAWFVTIINKARVIVDGYPEQNTSLFDLSIDTQITMLLSEILKPAASSQRGEFVEYAIANVVDISFLCDVFRYFTGDRELEGSSGQIPDAFGENTEKLRESLVEKVREKATSGELYRQVRPEDCLWFWWGAGYGAEVLAHTDGAMNNPDILGCLLKIPVTKVLSTAGNYETVDRSAWSKIVDLNELERRARNITRESSGDLYDIAERFLKALQRGRKSVLD